MDNEVSCVFWNVHDFDIHPDAMSQILAEVRSRDLVAVLPSAIVDIFGGDFNFID